MSIHQEWTVPRHVGMAKLPESKQLLELEHYLGYRLSILSSIIDKGTTRYLARDFGISLTERRVLSHLVHKKDSTVRGLAADIGLDRAAISRAAAALVDRQWATRSADPTDGRSALFNATSAGRKAEKDIIKVGQSRQIGLLNQLSPSEREAFYEVTNRLREILLDEDVKGIGAEKAA